MTELKLNGLFPDSLVEKDMLYVTTGGHHPAEALQERGLRAVFR